MLSLLDIAFRSIGPEIVGLSASLAVAAVPFSSAVLALFLADAANSIDSGTGNSSTEAPTKILGNYLKSNNHFHEACILTCFCCLMYRSF